MKSKTVKPKPKRKHKWRWLRYRKGDHAHNMVCAAQHWIHQNGGTAVVIGGIGLLDQSYPFVPGSTGRFQVCVGALGVMPKPRKEKAAKEPAA